MRLPTVCVALALATTSLAGTAPAMMMKTSPPVLSVSGHTLTWTPSPNRGRLYRNDYRVASKAPGQRSWTTVLLEDMTTRAYTPPAVPGATVRYKVKASYGESIYSNEVTITYAPRDQRKRRGNGDKSGA